MKTFKGRTAGSKPRNVVVGDGLSDADVWFSPEDSEVWEVMAADLSISPVHMAAVGKADPNKGMDTVRQLKRQKDEHNIVAAMTFVVGMLFVKETKDVDIYADD